MECNKEEAVRAKEIAVKKMENKDFVGARKAALMAQRLYSDLKDISQVILVCDVHCAAQNKVNGNEKDWYGILQVEPTVDEAAIKKQFRKLALVLHPDKNQFAGASDAFKFIGEAHKVLVDNQKRAVYDSKYKPFKTVQVSRRATQQGSRQSHPWLHKNVVSNPSPQSMNQQSEQPVLYTQTVRENKQPTFWTVCPFCSIKYQYYRDIVNRNIYCQNCKREFIAYETTTPNGANGIGSSKPENSQEQRTVNHGHFAPVKLSKPTNSPSKTQDQRSLNPENLQTDPSSGMAFTSDVNKEAKQNDNCRKRKTKTVNDKKKQNISAESCEIFETGGTTTNGHDIIIEDDGNNQLKQKSGYDAVKNPRGSAQFMQHDQNLNGDDEVLKPSKRSKSSQFINPDVVRPQVDHVREQTGLATDITKKHKEASLCGDVKASSAPEYFEYPIPDFNDFDELRRVGGFSPGQLWAVYDTLDGMPRFYALIKQVMSPGFKVRITWLEPHPDDEDKIKWLSVGLPTSCGKFRLGYTEDNEDHDMFSHLAHWERPNRNNVYTIYPRKGETWAIFKNWDLNWYSTLVDKTNYKFEFVEVLSDYADGVGVRVAYLAKITGFTSLFCRTIKEGRDSDVIPAEHLFKFSHKVPSFRMNGKEKEGKNVPAGSFELDPASLPLSHEGIEVLPNSNTDTREISMNGSSRSAVDILEAKNDVKQDGSSTAKPAVHASLSDRTQVEAKSKGKSRVVDEVIVEGSPSLSENKQLNGEYREKEHLTKEETEAMKIPQEVDLKFNDIASSSQAATSDEDLTVPDPDFNNFDDNRTRDKFKVGQIWAIYCEEDALPRYYCIIRRIDSPPHFGIYLQWLTACAPSKGIIRWVDKRMTISCGNFRLGKKEALKYDNTDAFSHEVKVELIKEKNNHVILPQKGDVWALYKDWSKNLAHSDLKKFKYEVTEVLEKNEAGVKVMLLERVRGLKSVFRPQTQGGSTVTMVIPMAEILRFSHQVPAVRLSEEREGSLRGFWEIDTASLPAYVFSSN